MAGFFPGQKYGGPPVSVDNFFSLMKGHSCWIISKNHDKGEHTNYPGIHDGWNDRGNCKVCYLSDKDYKKHSFEKAILELHPDIIYLQGLFQACILPCLQLAKKHHLRVILAPRGELCTGALTLKKYKKLLYIAIIRCLGVIKNIHYQSTSDEETAAIERWLNINVTNIHYLENIPSITREEFRRNIKIGGKGSFVFISRIHPKKNVLNAIKYFHKAKGMAEFDVYGPIEDERYWRECEAEIKKLPKNVVVTYRGIVSHEKVHEIFSQYDAFLFPTFSENYGHVIAECLMVGTPVIISDQTPWRCLQENGAGWDLDLRNESEFIAAINCIINSEEINRTLPREYAIHKMNLEMLKKTYEEAFTSIAYKG